MVGGLRSKAVLRKPSIASKARPRPCFARPSLLALAFWPMAKKQGQLADLYGLSGKGKLQKAKVLV